MSPFSAIFEGKTALRWWIVGLLCFPILLLFSPTLLQDRSLAFRDTAHFYHPLFAWIESEARTREVPLWNPHVNYGVSVVGEGTSSLFYPGKVLFWLPLEFSWCWKLYIVGHVLLAAVNAYIAARKFEASSPAAVLCGISFSCGGAVLFQYCNIVYLVAAAWVPLAFWAIEIMLRQGSLRAAIGLGILLALMTLGGDPQMAYHVVMAAAGYAMILVWQEKRSGSQNWRQTLTIKGSYIGLAGIVAGVLSAVQVLPASEASQQSERVAYNAPRSIYEAWPMLGNANSRKLAYEGLFQEPQPETHAASVNSFAFAPWHLAELIWPKFGGSYFPVNRRWLGYLPSEPRLWNPTIYCGLLPICLALGAFVLRRGTAQKLWLSWLVLIALLGSFGPFGLVWFIGQFFILIGKPEWTLQLPDARVGGVYWFFTTFLPGYAYFRFPAKLLTFAAFPLALLAAQGFDGWRQQGAFRLAKTLIGLCFLSVLLAIALLLFRHHWLIFTTRVPSDSAFGIFDKTGSHTELVFTLLHCAVVAGIGAWLLSKRETLSPWSGWAIVILTVGELTIANASLITTAPSEYWRTEPIITQLLRADCEQRGIIPPRVRPFAEPDPDDKQFFAALSSEHRIEELNWFERHLGMTNHAMPAGIHSVDALVSQRSADYSYWFRRFHKNEESYWGNYWVMPQNRRLDYMPQWEEIVSQEFTAATKCRIYRHKQPFPRAWVVHKVEVMPELNTFNPVNLNQRGMNVLGEDFITTAKRRDFSIEAIVESDQKLSLQPESLQQATPFLEPVHWLVYSPNRIVLEVQMQQAGLLILGDMYAPQWKAHLLNNDTTLTLPILRTNRCFRGVMLPAGKHKVEFVYYPQKLYLGATVSLLGWSLLAILSFFFRNS